MAVLNYLSGNALTSNMDFFYELEACFKKPQPYVELDGGRGFVINEPELVTHILVRNHKNYIKGPEFARVKMLTGMGLIVIDGESWRKHRQLLRPVFSKDSFSFFDRVIRTETERLFERWTSLANNGGTIELSEDISRFALDIIVKCIFSEGLDHIRDNAEHNPFDIFVENRNRDVDLARSAWQLRKKIKSYIEHRRSCTECGEGMLDVMMHSKLKDGSTFSDKELIDEVMTLIVAGHETSAITISWMWLLLSLNPQSELRLRSLYDASDKLNGGDGHDVGVEVGAELYLEQVMAEALRLYPPVWMFSRKSLDDDQWQDAHIPASTTVFLSPYYLQRSPLYWDSPEQFIPERFDGKSIRDTRDGSYIPFSAGPRRCIGDQFSLLEAQILFARIMPRLSLKAAEGYQIDLEPAVNLRSAEPIYMTVESI